MAMASRQLQLIKTGLGRSAREILKGDRRASVACILRTSVVTGTLEMFFILRSGGTGGARWSGQVAFPGGHVEDNESDLEAAIRECREEVGFNLDSNKYVHLGEVRKRAFPVGEQRRRLVVCCHVFEQCIAEVNIN